MEALGDPPISYYLEIELTTFCNLRCIDCDRQCRQAPSSEHMTVGQIRRFLNELRSAKTEFEQITLLGGEPLTHPHLFEILAEFKHHGIQPYFVTNGYGAQVRQTLRTLLEMGYSVADTRKRSIFQRNFDRMNIAPIDFGLKAEPCWILKSCGYGLSRYGFYPCGAGAAIDRVMGFDVGIKALADIGKCYGLTNILCQYCGHSEAARLIPPEVRISPSWQKALRRYRESRPVLSLYEGE